MLKRSFTLISKKTIKPQILLKKQQNYSKNFASFSLQKKNLKKNLQVRRYTEKVPHLKIDMPALSPTMTEGTIANWLVKEGDSVQAGDAIAEIQTDKAVVPLETQEDGFVGKIIQQAGDKIIKVGELIAIMVEEESDVAKVGEIELEQQTENVNTNEEKVEKDVKSTSVENSTSESQPDVPHQMVLMPALSPTMTEGTIAQWNFKVGDKIESADVLAEINTDKAVVGLDVQDGGYLSKIFVSAGDQMVKVGDPIAVLVENEADVNADFKQTTSSTEKKETTETPKETSTTEPAASASTSTSTSSTTGSSGDRVFASPLAKKLANEKGINLSQVTGTGPNGRITKEDIESFKPKTETKVSTPVTMKAETPTQAKRAAPAESSTSDFKDLPVTQIRKVIAARLLESKQTIPHYYLSVDCQVDELMKVREKLNKEYGKTQNFKLSVNDFIIKAASKALLQVPQVNSSWRDTFIREYQNVDISVAVQTDNGLITPIVFNASGKGLKEISQDVKTLAGKAKEGKLAPQEFQGGTFTVSNLGMFGIKEFSAIINPPQAAILAVGTTFQNVVPVEGEEIPFKTTTNMTATLSCDHRVVDGAVGAQWLKVFKEHIEDPWTLLL
eukprot:gene5588-9404_t